MMKKNKWVSEVEIVINEKNFLTYEGRTFIVDDNTIKIIRSLKSNDLNFDSSLNYLNNHYYSNNLSRKELEIYLNNLCVKIVY